MADSDHRLSSQRFASLLNALSPSCWRRRLWSFGCEGAAGRDESSLPIVVSDLDRRRVTVAATENRRPLCIGKADDKGGAGLCDPSHSRSCEQDKYEAAHRFDVT